MYECSVSDADFLIQLEQRSFGKDDIDHLWHLRVAWVYLKAHPWPIALQKVVDLLRTERNFGLGDIPYHHTLTIASLRIINVRISKADYNDFCDFLNDNQDLVDDMPSVIKRYYSEKAITSEAAQTSYVAPDLRPIE
ncbi:hypothetical protein DEU29_10343 [Idiomarina aquatica]|uniref:Uncharacterized protein n=1 Tax=Idiomarina aquatica TaxID=1327752 RepID=A0A4R6PM69_9GAMM|nr:hypothetical protein [Idiomarina aquatica]TDP39148.1 hypothetical protein DEU29_10343 [Idiomarina aquatica]